MPQTQVYPRWRGEHISSRTRASFRLGLSPLARGTLLCRFHITGLPRFIPAGAGNTTVQTAGYYFFAVYPRWCGEHNVRLSPLCVVAGLSPLARGTHISEQKTKPQPRFIPAGAGNTLVLNRPALETPVYPRWRGEHIYQNISFYSHGGLSPLARGTRQAAPSGGRGSRFIPAGAGNTAPISGANPTNTVYPRWRGEHRGKKLMLRKTNGLSPLARGTPAVGTVKLRYCRFIPAGAGNTRC